MKINKKDHWPTETPTKELWLECRRRHIRMARSYAGLEREISELRRELDERHKDIERYTEHEHVQDQKVAAALRELDAWRRGLMNSLTPSKKRLEWTREIALRLPRDKAAEKAQYYNSIAESYEGFAAQVRLTASVFENVAMDPDHV